MPNSLFKRMFKKKISVDNFRQQADMTRTLYINSSLQKDKSYEDKFPHLLQQDKGICTPCKRVTTRNYRILLQSQQEYRNKQHVKNTENEFPLSVLKIRINTAKNAVLQQVKHHKTR